MKTLITFLACAAMALGSYAQTGSSGSSDTTEIKVGKKVISIVKTEDDDRDVTISNAEKQPWPENQEEDKKRDRDKKKEKNIDVDFINLDLGMNFLTQNQNFNLPAELNELDTKPLNSTHFGMHFLKTRINLISHHVNLVTAITLDNNRFAFRDNFTILPGRDTLTLVGDSVSYRKNKLISWYAQIPLMLNFQTNPSNEKKNFSLSVGGYAGLLINGKTKRKSENGSKFTENDDFNLNRFRYGVTGRIGYRNVELYCNYNLSSMFVEGQGPEIMPVTFGISLTGLM